MMPFPFFGRPAGSVPPDPAGPAGPAFSQPPSGPAARSPHVGRIVAAVVLVLAVLLISFNSFYTIGEQENAVVTTFGSPQAVTASGLHFKLPFIQSVRTVNMSIYGLPIGYVASTNESIPEESLMITSDYNFVNVDFYIEYRVTNPIAYLYHSQEPIMVLKSLAMSYIRDTVGSYPIDDVITTGKSQIQAEVREKLTQRLEQQSIGLQVVNVTIQDAEPPTAEVQAAFQQVEEARQNAEQIINEANRYRSEQLPKAEASADQILRSAEAEQTARVNEANGQVARFDAMYAEYVRFPIITRQRMYYEAMEELLPDLKIIIADGDLVKIIDNSGE